jgi:hypothetical protein
MTFPSEEAVPHDISLTMSLPIVYYRLLITLFSLKGDLHRTNMDWTSESAEPVSLPFGTSIPPDKTKSIL